MYRIEISLDTEVFMKRILSVILLLTLLLSVLASCSDSSVTETQSETETEPQSPQELERLEPCIIDDSFRNWYSIYVYSFCDSDGDGVGDIKGVTQRLDYIKELGFNGIRLMPIFRSDNVSGEATLSFYEVDPRLGSVQDLEELASEAEKRGIKLIIDLELNHTSVNHPIFVQSCEYIYQHGVPLGNTYCFTEQPLNTSSPFISNLEGTALWYECRNLEGLPDISLDSAYWREEIPRIMGYWLECGIDGFYLCDVGDYYATHEQNIDFLSWLTERARENSSDCYLVGEVWTLDNELLAQYYETGIDSFVVFGASDATGVFHEAIRLANGGVLGAYAEELYRTFDDSIISGFIANNNTANRPASFLGGIDQIKMIFGLMTVTQGSLFSFYGDEIGMISPGGINSEAAKLFALKWNEDGSGCCTVAPDGAEGEATYIYPSVEAQQKDANSILSYYKNALYIRNCLPSLSRGDTEYIPSSNTKVCILKKTYGDEQVYVVINLNYDLTTVKLDPKTLGFESLIAELCSMSTHHVSYDSTSAQLTLPPFSIAFFR